MEVAAEISRRAEIFLVVGTSLVVYPAASLIDYVNYSVPKFIVDPGSTAFREDPTIHFIREKASTGMEKVRAKLISEYR